MKTVYLPYYCHVTLVSRARAHTHTHTNNLALEAEYNHYMAKHN